MQRQIKRWEDVVIYGERAGTDLSEHWFVLKDTRILIQACVVQVADEMLHEQTFNLKNSFCSFASNSSD